MRNWEELFAERALAMKASDIREAFKLTESPEVISFAGGFPSAEYFPVAEVGEILAEVLTRQAGVALQYGPTEGHGELRRQIAELMAGEGITATPEEVLLTSGSQQGLDLIGKVFLNTGDLVLVEKPGYIGGLGALAAYQPRMEGIPLDEHGLQVEVLAQRLAELAREGVRPKLLYTVANFHNPTGVTLSLARRHELLRLAKQYGFLIIEDNPYGEIYFQERPAPCLRALDGDGTVIYLGSFSKIFLPGLRVGWVLAPEPVIRKLVVAKQSMDLCGSTLSQMIVSAAIRRGFFPRHLPEVRQGYKEKRDAMLRALERYAPEGVTWTRPQGGFFVWLTLPEGLDAKVMLGEAIAEKVAYVGGAAFHLDGTGQNTIRLAYSQNSVERIEEGIRRLCRVLSRHVDAGKKACAMA